MPRTRSRASARKAGSWFQSQTRDVFRKYLNDKDIQVAPSWGAKDQGDVIGVKTQRVNPVTILVTEPSVGSRLAIECKNVKNLSLPAAIDEATTEAANYGALAGVVVHKRWGTTDPLKQIVSMTMADLIAICTGRPVVEVSDG